MGAFSSGKVIYKEAIKKIATFISVSLYVPVKEGIVCLLLLKSLWTVRSRR